MMEPRTGKTLVALSLVDLWKPRRILIGCPKPALRVWEDEISKHWIGPFPELRLLNLEQLWPRRVDLKKWCPDLVIIDESHRIKRRSTKCSKAARQLARIASRRLLLTGTPTGQGYEDLWAQLDFIDSLLLGKWSEFETRYLRLGGFRGKKIVGYQHVDELVSILNRVSFSITLTAARGRPCRIRHSRHYFELGPEELRVYRELERGLVSLVSGREIETPLVITQVMKLQQVTGGAILDEEGQVHRLGQSKLHRLMQLLGLEEAPVVVVARFLHEINAIDEAIRQRGGPPPTVLCGGRYDLPADYGRVLIQIQSAVAIDLSRASRIIWFSPDYSFLNAKQARFRILSYNSSKISYDYLVARGTVDEDIYSALARKQRLASVIINNYRREKWKRNP